MKNHLTSSRSRRRLNNGFSSYRMAESLGGRYVSEPEHNHFPSEMPPPNATDIKLGADTCSHLPFGRLRRVIL